MKYIIHILAMSMLMFACYIYPVSWQTALSWAMVGVFGLLSFVFAVIIKDISVKATRVVGEDIPQELKDDLHKAVDAIKDFHEKKDSEVD